MSAFDPPPFVLPERDPNPDEFYLDTVRCASCKRDADHTCHECDAPICEKHAGRVNYGTPEKPVFRYLCQDTGLAIPAACLIVWLSLNCDDDAA